MARIPTGEANGLTPHADKKDLRWRKERMAAKWRSFLLFSSCGRMVLSQRPGSCQGTHLARREHLFVIPLWNKTACDG
jgi:hypothetical protein